MTGGARTIRGRDGAVVKIGDTLTDSMGKQWELVRARLTARARNLKVVVRSLDTASALVLQETCGDEFGLTWEE